MEKTGEYKECPVCFEDIKAKAYICCHCGSAIKKMDKYQEGRFIRVKIRTDKKSYRGELYINEIENRVSDIVNDNRKFISLVNATEEGKLGELEIGYVAINKSIIETIDASKDYSEKKEQPFYTYTTNREI